MPTYVITSPDGKKYKVTGEGTREDALAHIQNQLKTAPQAPEQLPPGSGIGRQLGLTARYLAEGPAQVADIFTEPVRILINKGLELAGSDRRINQSTSQLVGSLATQAGAPSPGTPTERAVGEASKFVAGAGTFVGPAQLASKVPGAVGSVAKTMAAKPTSQAVSAAAGGYAGKTAEEFGAGAVDQFATSLLAALVAGGTVAKADYIARKFGSKAKQAAKALDSVLREYQLKWGSLPKAAQDELTKETAKALKSGTLNKAALKRLVEYRVVGLTPTRGKLTLDPVDITTEKNLAKAGANSASKNMQQLARLENENNQKLIQFINRMNPADEGAQAIAKGGVEKRINHANTVINRLYGKARDSQGRSALLDADHLKTKAAELLKRDNAAEYLPAGITKRLDDYGFGAERLTVDAAENLKTSIATLQRNSSDGNVRHALKLVREALDDTPIAPGQVLPDEAKRAYSRARRYTYLWKTAVKNTPALKAIEDGVAPDDFVQKFVISKTARAQDVASLAKTVKKNPAAKAAVREVIVEHLKTKALGGAPDEIANFSASRYNNAIKAIGTQKLKLVGFTDEEITKLTTLGRVAAYETAQVRGSAVNNSNTAAMVFGWLDKLRMVPAVGPLVSEPLQNMAGAGAAGQILRPRNALYTPIPKGVASPVPIGLVGAAAVKPPQDNRRD